MTLILVALMCVVLVLAATILWQNEQHYRERQEIARQIGDLLQRIQAPQIAVMQHEAQAAGPVPMHVPFDDDEEFQASKDELADLGWKEELSGSR